MNVLTDLSDAALARAVEENEWELLRAVADLPDGEVRDAPDVLRYSSGVPVAFMNGIARARFEPADVDRRIEEALAPFRSRGLPATWTVGPASTPPDLGRRLIDHGVELQEITPGMACDLRALPGATHTARGLEVHAVGGEGELESFLAVATAAFASEPAVADAIRRWYRALVLARPDLVLAHVARLNDRAVGGSIAFCGAGVVGLYGVATVPEARNLGVGRAVSLSALLWARDRGYRAGVLTSTDMGMPVYARLGFRRVCTLARYAFSPSA